MRFLSGGGSPMPFCASPLPSGKLRLTLDGLPLVHRLEARHTIPRLKAYATMIHVIGPNKEKSGALGRADLNDAQA